MKKDIAYRRQHERERENYEGEATLGGEQHDAYSDLVSPGSQSMGPSNVWRRRSLLDFTSATRYGNTGR